VQGKRSWWDPSEKAGVFGRPSFLSVGRTRRSTLLGGESKTNGGNMAEPIRVRTREGKLAGIGQHDARLGRVVQVKKRGGGNPLI